MNCLIPCDLAPGLSLPYPSRRLMTPQTARPAPMATTNVCKIEIAELKNAIKYLGTQILVPSMLRQRQKKSRYPDIAAQLFKNPVPLSFLFYSSIFFHRLPLPYLPRLRPDRRPQTAIPHWQDCRFPFPLWRFFLPFLHKQPCKKIRDIERTGKRLQKCNRICVKIHKLPFLLCAIVSQSFKTASFASLCRKVRLCLKHIHHFF